MSPSLNQSIRKHKKSLNLFAFIGKFAHCIGLKHEEKSALIVDVNVLIQLCVCNFPRDDGLRGK